MDHDHARADDALRASAVAGLAHVPENSVEFVWRNEEGGFTFRYPGVDGAEWMYLTWAPSHRRNRLESAWERARWVSRHIRVPHYSVIREGLGGWWMTSAGLPGESAVSRWARAHPETAIRAVATGLRTLHDTTPLGQCPYSWDMTPRVRRALKVVADSSTWNEAPDGYLAKWDAERAYAVLFAGMQREVDSVVCHGDACAPNTILDPATGSFVGLVDLGGLGVADRWADLAVASWSLNWNYGPGWESLFFEEYGVERDQGKIDFYRLLWNTGP